jgi:exosortase
MKNIFNIVDHFSRIHLLSFLLAISFLWCFSPVWKGLLNAWSSSDDYSHGFLIVPLSFYILWQKRDEIRKVKIRPTWLVFPLVLLSLVSYIFADYAEIKTLSPLAMILFLGSSLFFLFGKQFFKVCSFPLFLLLFMVPVPAQIYAELTIPLQLFVTKTTAFILSFIGIPHLREGNVLHLPEHTMQVVQACSGLRSIMSLLTLGVVIGYFSLASNLLRTILFVFAIPIAILVNVVRLLLIVIILYYYNFDLASGMPHTVLGILVFCLAILFFILLRRCLTLCEK